MKIKLLIVAIFTYQSIFSQTSVPGGIVNGIWTLAGSPYNVQGSIQIVNGDSLIIQPGVTVSFQGTYKLLVLGKLKAIGTITDTIIFTAANTAAGWRGIRFDNTPSTNDTSRIMYCKIQYGRATGSLTPEKNGGGVYFYNVSKAVVSNSSIFNCSADNNGGGVYTTSGSPTIKNNSIKNNMGHSNGGGIYIDSGSPTITYNIISHDTVESNNNPSGGNGAGIYCNGRPLISNNIISNNIIFGTFLFGNACAIAYQCGSSPIITSNIISNNEGAGISPPSICMGGLSSGYPSINGNTITNNTGYGIKCGQRDSALISNNIISHNGSCGIYCGPSNGNGFVISGPNIDNNTISNNSNGGIHIQNANGCDIIINNNIISYNTVSGTASNGGGIFISSGGTSSISNNNISNNTANIGGGIYCEYGGPSISNNTLTNNTALATGATNGGGGIYFNGNGGSYGNSTLTNNTIANNNAVNGGALYCTNSSSPTFFNCILWGNTADTSGAQVFLYDEYCDPIFYYSDIQGGSAAFELNGNFYTGTYQNNIDTNALFVSPSGGSGTGFNGIIADWALQAGSPCIDTGDPNGTYSTIDIAGNPRVSGGRIDIGAYELQVPAGIAGNKNSSTISIYPNPSSGKFTFQSTKENISQIEIYNLLGSTIYTQNVNHQTLNEIDLSGSPKGIYFAKLYNEEKSFTKKIVIE